VSQRFPSQFGTDPYYENPQGTIPGPPGPKLPRPWYASRTNFEWDATAVVAPPAPIGINYTYVWTSPIFDLRPDLRSADAGPKQGVPIWSRSDRLYIQLFAPTTTGLPVPLGWTVTAQEFGQTNVAQSQRGVGGAGATATPNVLGIGQVNVTAQFTVTAPYQQSIIAGFSPPGTTLGGGEGYPIRFWRLKLFFSYFEETGAPVPIPLPDLPTFPAGTSLPTAIQAAVY